MIIQSQTPSTRPLTTAHLAQTMTLMSLSVQELRQEIESELASNPALELIEERHCPSCNRPLPNKGRCPICSRPQEFTGEEPIVFVSPREDFYIPKGSLVGEGMPEEETAAQTEDLPTFVMRQIAPDLPSCDRLLAAYILSSLDKDGLLTQQVVEIARYHHVPPSRVESVLRLIQKAEPIGVGCSSPQDALLVQIEVLSETHPIPPMTPEAIRQGLEMLSHRQFSDLGRRLGISTNQVKEIANFIAKNLNPFPARAYWGENYLGGEVGHDTYHLPDVLITRLTDSSDSPLVVEIISPLSGRLRVNPLFRKAIHQAPSDKTEQWGKDIERASLLVKCLQQRNHTIVRLMGRLAVIQRQFILNGDAHMKPITRASLAKALDVHESTISRAVSSKTVQLPNGRIIPMAKLFDRSLHIRTVLREIIAQETKPLTDTQITRLLKEKGYSVARRTVAKYRSMEGILPAHLRGQLNPQPQ
jgi:RNA polymerase sigma-54 factor